MIDRRQALTTLTRAVAVTAALTLPTRRVFAQAASTTDTATVPGPETRLSAAQYRPMTLQAGTFAKQTSVVALGKPGLHPRVLEFAKFEADEQTAIAQTLTDQTNPPPAPLNATQQQAIAQLQGLQDQQFAIAYIRGQIEGHKELLAIQQSFLTGPVTDRDLEHIAVLARTVIMMHLTMLEDIQNTIAA